MTLNVKYVSKSGKSVIAELSSETGDVITTISGFVQLVKPGSKKVGDTIEVPWNAVRVEKRNLVDEHTGEIKEFDWLMPA